MNQFLQQSIEYANQKAYLDDLFRVYPTIPEGIRDFDEKKWSEIENHFNERNNLALIKTLLDTELFPIKDSYVAYLKRDRSSLERNPNTVNRLCGRLYEIGLVEIFRKCTLPKETNRQIGPMFKRWVNSGILGIIPVPFEEFISSEENAILDASDNLMESFARENLNYSNSKGLDFLARFNNKYIIGEAKFLTDFGGHQNAQFNDALRLLNSDADAIKIAILDGVLYIQNNCKMHNMITSNYKDHNIMSALVLREFLYSV